MERKWRTLVSGAEGPLKSESNAIEGQSRQPVSLDVTTPDVSPFTTDPKTKKRKLSDVPIAKGVPPAKKSAVGVPSSVKPVAVKKEPTKSAAPTVKDAKSDSSFFSAPKPKPKLPSFKKAPPAPSTQASKQQMSNNVAQPSSIDPFQEALKLMAKGRKESPSVSTPPATSTPVPQALPVTNGKKKKTVTWPSDDKLESVRLIEKAVYDDDPVDVSFLSLFLDLYDTLMTCPSSQFCGCFFSIQGLHVSHSLRDLDRGEGAALHAHIFEETLDWSEPLRKQMIIYVKLSLNFVNSDRHSDRHRPAAKRRRE